MRSCASGWTVNFDRSGCTTMQTAEDVPTEDASPGADALVLQRPTNADELRKKREVYAKRQVQADYIRAGARKKWVKGVK